MRLLPRTALAVAILCVSGVQAQTGERESGTPKPADRPPKLTLPPQVMVMPGQPFRVKVETECQALRLECPGVVVIPKEWLGDPDMYFAAVAPAASGTYTLTAEGTLGKQWAKATCLVICGTAPVPPAPPTPVPPTPTPPGPPSPLVAELQQIYLAERSPQKATEKASLAGLYRNAAGFAVRDQSVTTVGQLFAKLKNAGDLMVEDHLKPLRVRLSAEHKARFPSDAQALDATTRKAASEWFADVAAILDSLK